MPKYNRTGEKLKSDYQDFPDWKFRDGEKTPVPLDSFPSPIRPPGRTHHPSPRRRRSPAPAEAAKADAWA